jgi:hypothetical protein
MIQVGHVALPGQRVRCPLSESGGLGPGGCLLCPRTRPCTATQSDLQPIKGILAGNFPPQFAAGKILKCGELLAGVLERKGKNNTANISLQNLNSFRRHKN